MVTSITREIPNLSCEIPNCSVYHKLHYRLVSANSNVLVRKLLVPAWIAPNSDFKCQDFLLCPNRGLFIHTHTHTYHKREMDKFQWEIKR